MICLQHQFKSKRLPHLEQVQKGSPPSGQFPFITLPCSCTAFSQAFTVNWFWWRISDERQSSLDNNRLRMRLDFVNFYILQLQETEGAHYVRYYNHAISLPEFSSTTIRTDRWLLRQTIFSGVVRTKNNCQSFLRFQMSSRCGVYGSYVCP